MPFYFLVGNNYGAKNMQTDPESGVNKYTQASYKI